MKEGEYSFYQWSVADLQRHFDVDIKLGLSEKRAFFRNEKYGLNSLRDLKESGPMKIFIRQFCNFFIILLFIAAVISYFVDGLFQASILLIIILLNVFLGFFQEFKAEKALSVLKTSFKSKAKVLRDGKVKIIDNDLVTLGDIVVLEAGDIIPADLRVIESYSLSVDESALTGESLPVDKRNEKEDIKTPLAERKNMLFGSTTIAAGRGIGLVVAIGEKTEFGKIAGLVSQDEGDTPLEKQTQFIGKTLTIISFIIVGITFLLGYLRGYEILPLLTFAIALLVGAVPESLPTIITLALAIGVTRMASKKAIVRKLAVIETLGMTNIIATDKTGTLTNNELSVARVATVNKNNIVSFDFDSNFSENNDILELFEKAVLCSNVTGEDAEKLMGDPMDVSIIEKAKSFHRGIVMKANRNKRIMEIPFDSEKKYMAVLVESPRYNKREIIAKGASEEIVAFCDLSSTLRQNIKKMSLEMSREGLKVIALAVKEINSKSFSTLSNLKFIGLLGFVDEPSEGIKEAIAKTIKAGIRPIIITGDHPETARFVAKKIGFSANDDEVFIGSDIEKFGVADMKKALENAKIFARVTPEDKINIVDKLEKMGYLVAVTGDGVNDAPALKRASAGIAMGRKGTDVARDAADIILSDDKYGTIVSAIEYGRSIYDNIKDAIVFLLSGNFSELFLIMIAFIFGLPMPLLTLQILWINMITDSLPAIALAFEAPSAKVLEEKPRSREIKNMKKPIMYAVYLSLAGLVLGLILYLWGLNRSVEIARTLVFTFLVLQEFVYVLSIRSPYRIWQNVRSFFANKFMTISIAVSFVLQCLIFLKPFRNVFKISLLSVDEIVILIVMTIVSFLSAEVIRWQMERTSASTNSELN